MSGIDATRDNLIVAMYRDGTTMQQIGDALVPPVSRERIRQILDRNGVGRRGRGPKKNEQQFKVLTHAPGEFPFDTDSSMGGGGEEG